MERRIFIGSLPLATGIVGVSCIGAPRALPDNERHEDSWWRLHNAQAFFPKGDFVRAGDLFYRLGVVSQLALSACVVADGWSDEDCRRRIGLDVGKAHFFAKAGGLQFDSDHFARLVPLLSPYGRWRSPMIGGHIDVEMIDACAAKSAVSQLLSAVRLHLVAGVGKAPGR